MDTQTSLPSKVTATKRRNIQVDPSLGAIRADFKPQPGDVVVGPSSARQGIFDGTPPDVLT